MHIPTKYKTGVERDLKTTVVYLHLCQHCCHKTLTCTPLLPAYLWPQPHSSVLQQNFCAAKQ